VRLCTHTWAEAPRLFATLFGDLHDPPMSDLPRLLIADDDDGTRLLLKTFFTK
jgi:hypothetical protein